MNEVDEFGMMEVMADGVMERRPAEVLVISDILGRPLVRHATPEVSDGELLTEFLGRPSVLVRVNR